MRASLARSIACFSIISLSSDLYAQLSSDFSPSNFKDALNNLQKVASAYRDLDQAQAALSNTSDLQRIVNIMETEAKRYLATIESPRNPALRTHLALSYFYLGYAKALVGFAEDALFYFDKAKKEDSDIVYFQTDIDNRKGLIRDFIQEYENQLKNSATPIVLDVRTYKFDESIDPSKIQFIEVSQGKSKIMTSFRFYLLFALKNMWRYEEEFWTERDTVRIYFPNGRFRLSSLDSSVQEIEFEVPTTKHVVVRPLHWFSLELPEKAKLGDNFRIFRLSESDDEVEITTPESLSKLYFGHYRIKTKGSNLKCIAEKVNFSMEGFTYRDISYPGERRIPVPENATYKFQPCK